MLRLDDPELYRGILDGLKVGVYLVDRAGKILFWSAGAERITGYLSQDVVGHSSLEDLLGHVDGENNRVETEALPVSVALREGKPSDAQVSLRHKSGHRVLVRVYAAPIRDAHGSMVGAVESFEEVIAITDLTERQSKLAAYGCLDEASGVLNHAMMQAHLREALATFAEHPVPFSILSIAIDRLDEARSRYGIAVVAALLRVVGQTLENSLRPTDFVGRWDENEFVALLMECGPEEVVKAGERLRKMVNQSKVEWWGDVIDVTISMGGASARTTDTVETLVVRAEKGLRASIEQGGNRVALFPEQNEDCG
ncbi:MAG TPA: diguanylate cyclase [Methylomirabilota bacterium]|nr:diguanylate cyclase [Methylomirabilota bacterium]